MMYNFWCASFILFQSSLSDVIQLSQHTSCVSLLQLRSEVKYSFREEWVFLFFSTELSHWHKSLSSCWTRLFLSLSGQCLFGATVRLPAFTSRPNRVILIWIVQIFSCDCHALCFLRHSLHLGLFWAVNNQKCLFSPVSHLCKCSTGKYVSTVECKYWIRFETPIINL